MGKHILLNQASFSHQTGSYHAPKGSILINTKQAEFKAPIQARYIAFNSDTFAHEGCPFQESELVEYWARSGWSMASSLSLPGYFSLHVNPESNLGFDLQGTLTAEKGVLIWDFKSCSETEKTR